MSITVIHADHISHIIGPHILLESLRTSVHMYTESVEDERHEKNQFVLG